MKAKLKRISTTESTLYIPMQKLVRWSTILKGSRLIGRGGLANSPNPILAGNTLYTFSFAPALVFAIFAGTGRILWQRKLSGYGSSLQIHRGMAIASTCHEIVSLDLKDGSRIWRYRPYDRKSEWIYATPAVAGNQLFFGDNCGFFHCISVTAGKPIWKVKIAETRVVAKAVVSGEHVFTATNDGKAICLARKNGETQWETKLDGSSIQPLAWFEGAIIVTTRSSVYYMSRQSGKIIKRIKSPRGFEFRVSTLAGPNLLVAAHGNSQPNKYKIRIAIVRKQSVRHWLDLHSITLPSLAYSTRESLLYICHYQGLDTVDLESGEVKSCTRDSYLNLSEVPLITGNQIYVTELQGKLHALTLPLKFKRRQWKFAD